MKSNYDILGNHIRLVDYRNKELITTQVLGINIDKYFMPSVANVIGTDLSRYKLLLKGKFACNPMHVGRDERLPVALYSEDKPAIVSPAYFVFEIVDTSLLNEYYLMMWFRRPEFDRTCWLKTDGSVRGGISWDDICRLELPVPPIEKQLEIVNRYKAITDRIALKQKINDNLLAQAQIYFGNVFKGRDTEDTLPNNWEFATVGDYCVDNVSNLSKNDKYDTISYLDTGSITDNYIVELQELNLNKDEIPSRAKRKAFHGDIVYSTVRPNLHHYGLLQNPPDNLIVSTGFAVLHSKCGKISNELIFMWLTKNSVLEYLQAIAENSVSTYPSLNVSDLLNVKIVVPDDDTLRKLNLFLSTIFSIIDENNRQIKMLLNCRTLILPKLISSH